MDYEDTKIREGPRRSLAFMLALVSILVLGSSIAVFAQEAGLSRRARAQAAYQRAQRARARLESRPRQTAASYEQVVRSFELVYRIDPGFPKTPAALAAAAEVWQEMGHEFTSDRYYSKAVEEYQFLAAQYPHSSLAAEALYTAAGICLTNIENPAEARAAYGAFLKQFPRSARAADARDEIAKLDAQLKRWNTTGTKTAAFAASAASPGAAQNGAVPEVMTIRHWVGSDYTRVVVGLNGPVAFNAMHLENPPRLVFDLAGSRLSPSLARKVFPVENGFLERIRVAQFKPGITRLVLDVPQIEDYSVFSLPNPFRLVIDIHGAQQPQSAQAGSSGSLDHGHRDLSAKIKPGSEGRRVGNSLSGAANQPPREGQPDGLSGSARRTSTRYQTAETPEGTPAQAGTSLNAPAATNLPPTLTRALGLKIRRIVIDPGHGGKDTGTIGPTGLEEKNVVLDIGLRLQKLIERRMGCQVIMTRSRDVFIPLEERTAIANEYGADLFISIHANASHDPAARGIEAYYLNFTSDPQALQLAARENASSEDSVYQLQNLIKKIALSEKIDESRRFARIVDYQLAGYLDRSGDVQKNRGVKKAPFVVLIGANMPSILAEISFLSNPHDERLLRKASYREKIAVGLYDGIARYARSLGAIRVAEREPSAPDQPGRASRPDATGRHSAPSF